MANVGTIWSTLKLNINDFSNKLNSASSQLKAFSKTVNGSTNNAAQAMKDLKKKTDEYGLSVKSISRIVSGILISQAFYKSVQAINRATDAVWDFSSALEYAQIAYTNLFNDSALATEFINVLKDFAALSPFDFSESEQAAKRLVAYGIQYKNVMYIMQGVMSAAAMQGDSTKVESISRALGQIYTKGRLMNEEMRQLAEAGIPAYEILIEKLGLTQKQLQNLGNEAIPASIAINALVDGMTERFGSVSEASTKTMTGIISNIKDNATMLASNAFEPIYTRIKGVANAFGEWLYAMREISEMQGIGGVFEAIVPPEMLSSVRAFIANLINLGTSIGNIAQALMAVLKPALVGIMHTFNMFAPIISTVANALSALTYMIATNETVMKGITMAVAAATSMWLAYRAALLLAAVASKAIALMSAAVKGLSVALTFVLTHPFWALMLTMVGVVAALTGTFSSLGETIRSVFNTLTGFNGIDPDKLLLPSQKERANDLEKFNEKLDTTADSMDELADNTNKAKKNLLSFDEVYRLTSNDADAGIDTDIQIPNIDFNYDPETSMPEVPDFTGWTNEYISRIAEAFSKIKEFVSKYPIGAMLGSLLGAKIGGAIGGPVGAILGGLAGALVGNLIQEIIDFIKTGDTDGIGLSLGGLLGMAIGGVLGGPMGAFIGASIGLLVGGLVDAIIKSINEGETEYVPPLATALGGVIGGAIGFVIGGPAGVVIGAAIGSLVGWIIGEITEGISSDDWSGLSLSVSTALGAAIGFVVGGPGGAIIGASIGALVGWILDEIANAIEEGETDKVPAMSSALGTVVGAALGFVIGGPAGALIGAGIGTLAGWLVGEISEAIATGDWRGVSTPLGSGIGAAIGFVVGGPVGAVIGTAIGGLVGWIAEKLVLADWSAVGDAFMDGLFGNGGIFGFTTELFKVAGEFFSDIQRAFEEQDWLMIGVDILAGILSGLTGALFAIIEPIGRVFVAIFNAICEVFGIHSPAEEMKPLGENVLLGLLQGIVDAVTVIPGYIADVGIAVISAIGSWFVDIGTKVVGWMGDGVDAVKTFVSDTSERISTWATNTGAKVSDWASNTKTKITDWATTTAGNISSWASRTKETIGSWVANGKEKIGDWWTNVKGKFASFTGYSFTNWCNSTLDTISTWAGNVWGSIKDKIGKAIDKVKEFFGLKTDNTDFNVNASVSGNGTSTRIGHATGGVFDREHVARLSEGNKAEAVIPLEENNAMQPFVDAVANGITATLAPMFANTNSQQLQPLYVGTLIADDKSLKELERKMNIIRLQEQRR